MSDENETIFETPDELMRDLFRAERDQEITQIATTQGQIMALLIILHNSGLLQREQIDEWEELSGKIGTMLTDISRSEILSREEETDLAPSEQLDVLIRGTDSALKLATIMGSRDPKAIDGLKAHLEELRTLQKLEEGCSEQQ